MFGSITSTPEWARTLVIALVTSILTSLSIVILVEPVKARVQRRFKKNELRRCLYHEMIHNYHALRNQIELIKGNPEMKSGIAERFSMSFKKSSLKLAQSDPAAYYSLGHQESYWIELVYRDTERIATVRFKDDDQHFSAAEFATHELLSCIKNRNLSKRLLFKVAPVAWREDIRENLLDVNYVDISTPNWFEQLRRRFD
jgi:hypothetical protein